MTHVVRKLGRNQFDDGFRICYVPITRILNTNYLNRVRCKRSRQNSTAAVQLRRSISRAIIDEITSHREERPHITRISPVLIKARFICEPRR